MFKEAIFHKSDSTYAYAVDENTIVIKLRTKHDDVDRAVLCYGNRYDTDREVKISEKQMEIKYRDDLFDYYETSITTGFKTICYYFKISSGTERVVLSQDRFSLKPPELRNRYYMFSYICRGDLFIKGSWWEELVIYQIFVDRFNKKNIDRSWYRIPGHFDVYGGNLEGIIDRIDYLSNVGVNCIYLTPIFEASSNHKYDTGDYFNIDRNFGNNESFKSLVEKCHDKGIRVVLDAVYNHTGRDFFAFKDYIEKGSDSRYKDWYFIKEDGSFETFGNVKEMPKLNTTNPEVIEYLLKISRYWIREYGIDGWRLDVANEIDHSFWRKFREAVKKEKKDAIIIGEVWDGAESYLLGDQFDTVMNYPFMYTALDYFAKGSISTCEFDHLVNNLFARYKSNIRGTLVNLLDSHDTSRFLFECGNDVEKLKLAAFFQMTCIGIPMIFYGDEAGITGGNDPDCRRGMDFRKTDSDLYSLYKRLISIRKNSSAIKYGEYRTLSVGAGVYCYSRYTEDELIVNLFNSGREAERIEIKLEGRRAHDLLGEKSYEIKAGKLEISAEPYGKYIFKID